MSVVKCEDIIKQSTTEENKPVLKFRKKVTETIPKGKPKSGRFWKTPKTKFSTTIKTRGIKSSLERKEALRKELLHIKKLSRASMDAQKEAKERLKERRRENLKRNEANSKKSEIVQVIRNTSKIKRMKKKHLRNIEKRDTNDM